MKRKYAVLLAIFSTVLIADQVTKYLAVSELTDALERSELTGLGERIKGFVTLSNLDNSPYVAGQSDHRRPPVPVIKDYWHHRYVENPGAAWGMLGGLDERVRVPFFHVVSLAAITFILLFFRKLEAGQRLLAVALALVLGGAAGNYLDRILRGYVVDFIDWHWQGRADLHWPTFNVADAAISVGVVLMLAETLLARQTTGPSARAVAEPDADPGPAEPASNTERADG